MAGRIRLANMILDDIRSLPPMLESTLNVYHSLQRTAHMPRICRIEQSDYLPRFRNRSSTSAKGDSEILFKPPSQILIQSILRQCRRTPLCGNFYFCTKRLIHGPRRSWWGRLAGLVWADVSKTEEIKASVA